MDKLKEKNIPYQITGDGTSITVPESHLYETRLSLASEGLPLGGGVGFGSF